jgi:hypothetical protein
MPAHRIERGPHGDVELSLILVAFPTFAVGTPVRSPRKAAKGGAAGASNDPPDNTDGRKPTWSSI